MRVGVLFSGGKDSCYAMYKALQEHKVGCLISVVSENKESYMFHTANIELVDAQAEALGMPLVKARTKGVKEGELDDLKKALLIAINDYGIKGVVSGAIASDYQASRIRRICEELGLESITPLWGEDQLGLLREVVKHGFKVLIVGIAGYPLDRSWLGREINDEVINELEKLKNKIGLQPAGEGGEIETFVVDSPMHKKKVRIIRVEKDYANNTGIMRIIRIRLEDKPRRWYYDTNALPA